MRSFSGTAALLALALLVSACSQGPLVRDAPETEQAAGYPNHSVNQIVSSIEASMAGVRSVKSDGDLEIASPRLNQKASFSLRSQLADSTTAILRGPFGIVAARALLTPSRFVALDQLNKRLYEGSVLASERYVPGASERGARALYGLIAPESDISWTLTAGNALYQLVGRTSEGSTRTYVVDPALWRVRSMKEVARSGELVGTQTFEAFDTVDGVVLPRRVVLVAGENRVLLEHRALTPNPGDLSLRFDRPTSGYEVVTVR